MKESMIQGDNKPLQLLRMVSLLATFLYIVFGFFMKHVLEVDDPIPLSHRLVFAVCFGGLAGLSYISFYVRKHMALFVYALGCAAILNVLVMGTKGEFDAGSIVALLLVTPIMNFLFYRWKFLLYANALLFSVIVGVFTVSGPTLIEILLFLISIAAISGVSFWFSRRLLSTEVKSATHEQMFHDLFRHSLEGIAIHEMIFDHKGQPADYMFLEVNPTFEEYTGLKSDEILGKRVTKVLSGIEESGFIERYGAVVRTGEPVQFEQFSEPLQRYYRVSAYPMGDNRFAIAFEDITEHRAMERERHRLASEYEMVFQSTQDAMFLVEVLNNETFRYIRNNNAHAKSTGLDSYIVSGKTPEELVGEELARTINANYRICVEQGQPLSYEETLDLPGGTRTWSTLLTPVIKEGQITHIVGSSRDITDRKQMEDALRESEAQLKEYKDKLDMILANITDNVWSYDMDHAGNFLSSYISPAGAKQLGIGEEELNNSFDVWFSHVLPEDLPGVLEAWDEGIRDGQGHFVEYRIQRADGSIRWIRTKGAPVHKPNGGLRVVGVGQDITERKEMEAVLRVSEQRLHAAVRGTGAGIWDWDMVADSVTFSKHWKTMLGYEEHEIPNSFSGWQQLWHPDDAQMVKQAVEDHLLGKTDTYEVTHRLRHKSGDWRWIMTRGELQRDRDGRPLRWIGTNIDVTDQKRSEEELRKQSGLIQSLLDSIPDIIFYKDVEGVYLGCNPAFAEHVGLSAGKIVGKTDYQLYSKEVADEFRRNDQRMLELGRPRHNEESITYPDGRRIIVDTLKTPYVGLDGQLIGILGISRDITERKQMEDALRESEERLQKMLDTIPDMVSIHTPDMDIVYSNWSGFGAVPEEKRILQTKCYKTYRGLDDICPDCQAMQVFQTKEPIKTEVKLPNNRWIDLRVIPIKNDAGDVELFVEWVRDITERKRAEQEIEYLSFRDGLTGLYNRRFFDEELKRLDVPRNLPLTLMVVDVNGLKLINDSFGHAVGDQLLKSVADVLRNTFRQDDIISRIGGDEFAILLPNTDEEQADRLKKRLIGQLSGETVEGLPLSVACGLAVKTDFNDDMHVVFGEAEDHMYREKTAEKRSYRYQTIQLIMQTLFAKSQRERLHAERVSQLCGQIGTTMGLSRTEVDQLITAGELHDIGKISIDNEILDKNGSLSESEWEQIKRHPRIGHSILSAVNDYGPLAENVLAHHERWDGAGYPNGLEGTDIPKMARIIAVADAYDAMTSDRSYRKAMSYEDAMEEMEACAGSQFDPEVVKAFVEMMDNGKLLE